MTGVSQGRKLKLSSLSLPLPVEANPWFWVPMDRSGLRLPPSDWDVTPFSDVCWYSGWIMAGKQKIVRHRPERVLRQYEYVLTVPRPPTMIIPLAPADVVAAFLEFVLYVVAQQHSVAQVPDKEPWKHSDRYIRWFYRVSHPLIVNPAPEPDITMPRPVYQDILVNQDWALHPPDPLQVISSMRCRFQRWIQIHYSSAFWRASVPIIACLSSSRFWWGGLGVHRSSSSVLF